MKMMFDLDQQKDQREFMFQTAINTYRATITNLNIIKKFFSILQCLAEA